MRKVEMVKRATMKREKDKEEGGEGREGRGRKE